MRQSASLAPAQPAAAERPTVRVGRTAAGLDCGHSQARPPCTRTFAWALDCFLARLPALHPAPPLPPAWIACPQKKIGAFGNARAPVPVRTRAVACASHASPNAVRPSSQLTPSACVWIAYQRPAPLVPHPNPILLGSYGALRLAHRLTASLPLPPSQTAHHVARFR